MAHSVLRTSFLAALPFWVSLLFVPILFIAGWNGGFWLILAPLYGWWATSLIDFVAGLKTDNPLLRHPH